MRDRRATLCCQLGDLACTSAMQASQEEQERADAAVAAFMFGFSEQAGSQAGSLQNPEAASSSTAPGDVVASEDILAQMDTHHPGEQAARAQGCVNHQSGASIVDWPGNPGVDCRALHKRKALCWYMPAAWALSTEWCLRRCRVNLVAAPASSCLAAYWPEPERVPPVRPPTFFCSLLTCPHPDRARTGIYSGGKPGTPIRCRGGPPAAGRNGAAL